MVGLLVGDVGAFVGTEVGIILDDVGTVEGTTVGLLLGTMDGATVGSFVGTVVGTAVGLLLGTMDEAKVGLEVGGYCGIIEGWYRAYMYRLSLLCKGVISNHLLTSTPTRITSEVLLEPPEFMRVTPSTVTFGDVNVPPTMVSPVF